jgi:GT2 family glycosyltransferase/peptidoglycan/xylan/chitin deacetylase (PgdA/CDA1 family)
MNEAALTVIIPTYNRAEMLRACLESLRLQTRPCSDFEVVVVVDGSTDGTRELLQRTAMPYRLRVIEQPNSGQHVARNRGGAAAAAPCLLFLDDDMVAAPELVAEHLRAHGGGKWLVGLGKISMQVPGDAHWFVRSYSEAWAEHYASLHEGRRSPSWIDCWGGNVSMPREAFLRVGGFATDLLPSEDCELGYRLARHGVPCVYVPDAMARHDGTRSFRELTAVFEQQGAAALALYQRHPPTLPHLLGSFRHVRRRMLLLRRLLLALDMPSHWLGALGSLPRLRPARKRLYYFVERYCFWRGVRRATEHRDTWRRLTAGTPILMYHALDDSGGPGTRFVTPARRFAAQMGWLKRAGFTVLSVEDYLTFRQADRLPPARSVVITFDDGYRDTFELAAPVLRRLGLTATVFIVTHRVGTRNSWDATGELVGRPLMRWSELQTLLSQGMRVGAHTRTHPMLTALPPEAARDEIDGSRSDLETRLGVAVEVFAYPYAKFDAATQGLAEAAGFLGSCTDDPGSNTPITPSHALRRVEVRGTDSLPTFLYKAWSGRESFFRRRPLVQS